MCQLSHILYKFCYLYPCLRTARTVTPHGEVDIRSDINLFKPRHILDELIHVIDGSIKGNKVAVILRMHLFDVLISFVLAFERPYRPFYYMRGWIDIPEAPLAVGIRAPKHGGKRVHGMDMSTQV